MAGFALHDYLAQAWRVVGAANRYFTAEEPWIRRRTDPARMATVLWVTAEVLRDGGAGGAARDAGRHGQAARPPRRRARGARLQLGFGAAHRLMPPAPPLPAPAVIFPRYVEAEAEAGAKA